MALSEFRETQSWQGAIELGPQLVRLAEELPAAEQMGLSYQLRQVMVDLPTAVAVDLLEGGSNTRKPATLRLVAMLDLIEKIYPALDTAEVRTAVERLANRLASNSFGEQTAGAPAAYLPGATIPAAKPATPEAPAPAPADVPVVAETDQPAPTHSAGGEVQVSPDGHISPAGGRAEAAETAPVTVQVAADPASEEVHVHSDSVQ